MCPPPIHRAETRAAFSHESGGREPLGVMRRVANTGAAWANIHHQWWETGVCVGGGVQTVHPPVWPETLVPEMSLIPPQHCIGGRADSSSGVSSWPGRACALLCPHLSSLW